MMIPSNLIALWPARGGETGGVAQLTLPKDVA
jgi:hypothetical protein